MDSDLVLTECFQSSDSAFYHFTDRLNPFGKSVELDILFLGPLLLELLEQGYVKERLKSSSKKFYGRYGDLIKQYEVPLSRMLNDISVARPNTMTTLHRSDFITTRDFFTELDLLPNYQRIP